jgi:hypothetical protein
VSRAPAEVPRGERPRRSAGNTNGAIRHGLGAYRDRVAARRGRNIGTVAAARELVELVYYALRDYTVRRLASPAAAAAA